MKKRNPILFFTTVAITLFTVGTGQAHRQWILPSTTVLSGENQWVSVEAAISNDLFFPNHHAMRLSGISALSPTGKSLELKSPAEGEIRSSFELLLEEQGTYRIFSQRKTMFASWKENGESKRMRTSAEELEKMDFSKMEDLKLREFSGRVESIVTCGEPTELKPNGEGIELEFITHPNDLFSGETTTFKVLLNGKPVVGQEVTIIKGDDRFRNSVDEIKATSNDEGIVEIIWPEAGRFWLTMSADLEAAEFKGTPVDRGTSYTLTLEVLPE